MDLREFVDRGYLQEVNRLLLHPLGLALACEQDDSGDALRLSGIIDSRDDPDGMIFAELTDDDVQKADQFANEMRRRAASRLRALGYVIQPLPGEVPETRRSGGWTQL
jgi:hypothetical protein